MLAPSEIFASCPQLLWFALVSLCPSSESVFGFWAIATWLERIAPGFLSAESADILVSIEILVEAEPLPALLGSISAFYI